MRQLPKFRFIGAHDFAYRLVSQPPGDLYLLYKLIKASVFV